MSDYMAVPPAPPASVRVLDLHFPARRISAFPCLDMCEDTYHVCTRRRGHAGRHASNGADYVVQVWGQG